MKACSFDTVLAYYAYLTSSEKKDDELRELLNRLTINHTYFFRNEPQFKVLKEKVLPELVERGGLGSMVKRDHQYAYGARDALPGKSHTPSR